MLSSRSPVLRGQACGTTQAHLNANLALHPSRHFLYGEAVQSNWCLGQSLETNLR